MSVVEERISLRHATHLIVPVGFAIVTWGILLIGISVLARAESLGSLLSLLVVAVMLWPLAIFAPWRSGLTDRTVAWVRNRQATILLAIGLAVVIAIVNATGFTNPVIGILQLPYRASGAMFGASLFYRDHLGPGFARVLLRGGQWYLEGLWLYVAASLLVKLGGAIRP